MEPEKKILLVEEDAGPRRHFSEILALRGWKVVLASDAASAVQEARRHKPDLILVNYGLPGGGGPIAIERLKMLNSTSAIPIVVLSDEDPSLVLRDVFLKGAVDFVSKQADPEELFRTIETHLHQSEEP